MARPRAYKTDDVLKAAMGVFWAKGYVATSMADIYAATGLKPGNLYPTFTDKETLFRRAFEAYADQFNATLPRDASGIAAIRAWLATQAGIAITDPARKGCLIVNTLAEREAHAPETRALADTRLAEIRGFFATNLSAAVKAEELPADADQASLADHLTGTVIAIMSLGRARAPEAMIRNVAKQALAGLAHIRPERRALTPPSSAPRSGRSFPS